MTVLAKNSSKLTDRQTDRVNVRSNQPQSNGRDGPVVFRPPLSLKKGPKLLKMYMYRREKNLDDVS
jgi:hypothetical protein